MSPRRRYYHPPTAAVLAVLGQEDDRVWSVDEVAEEAGLVSYASAYSILQRLWGQGLVARLYIDGGIGHVKLHFDLSDRGWAAREQVLRFMPNPVAALQGLTVPDDDEQVSDKASGDPTGNQSA
jgi:DNA-binding PadR family transcriptional regulator